MKILLTDAGKRFNRDWIFRNFSYEFQSGTSYAITGPNGSGKSTLLQVLSGNIQLSEGKGTWLLDGSSQKNDVSEQLHKHLSICAPYLEVVEEMTFSEFLSFHSKFKPLLPNLTIGEVIELVGLENAADKQIRYYSSGMKQRVKLAQSILSDVPLVLLDEPCTNLDEKGIELYHRLINEFGSKRLVVVSSNDKTEYSFCQKEISLTKMNQVS